MKWYERYLQKDNEALVRVLESPEDYQNEVLLVAREILDDRQIPFEQLQNLARDFQRKQISNMLNTLDPLNDELRIPYSYFLNREEVKELLQEEFKKFLSDKDAFRFDVWKYAIGGL